jgi:hypothetical protein
MLAALQPHFCSADGSSSCNQVRLAFADVQALASTGRMLEPPRTAGLATEWQSDSTTSPLMMGVHRFGFAGSSKRCLRTDKDQAEPIQLAKWSRPQEMFLQRHKACCLLMFSKRSLRKGTLP